MKIKYSQLRAYYRLKEKYPVGVCIFPIVRQWIKSQLFKKEIHELVHTTEGFLVPVNSFNKETRHVQIRGSIDNSMSWIVKRYVKNGSTAIDVGSNLGFITLLMAEKVGAYGKIISIEPNAHLNSYFYNLMHINRIDNVRLINCVCTDEHIKMPFSINESEHKKSRIDTNSIDYIQGRTIDEIVDDQVDKVSFIKIDVEGFEHKVIAGAINTIKNHRPTLVFETGLHDKEQIIHMNNLFLELKYEVIGVIHEWGIEPKKLSLDMTDKTHCNVLAIPKNS